MTPAQVAEIAAAGGRLIATPHADAAIVRAARRRGLISVPGFFTPADAFAMLAAGADGLKLFPAEAASPAVLRALRAVLPAGNAVLPSAGSMRRTWRAGGARARPGSASARRSTGRATVAKLLRRRRVDW